ncbi:hypothetical protein BDR06DRAFT_1014951 [Suillus hirtellus]|nr:hypothetical protein BDR06DRAFT_1014951 [Suillus hirtellus]
MATPMVFGRYKALLEGSIATLSGDFYNVLRNTAGVGEEKMREKQLIPVFCRLWDAVLAPVVEVLLTIMLKASAG